MPLLIAKKSSRKCKLSSKLLMHKTEVLVYKYCTYKRNMRFASRTLQVAC